MTIDPKLFEGHTGGDWEPVGRGIFADGVQVGLASHPRDVEDDPGGRFVATYEESIANAKLFAGAPALLARVAELEDANRKLVEILARVESDAEEPAGDYLFGLRCGVEDRGITDRYEAAEYGWRQAFNYVASALSGIGDDARAALGPTS